MKKIALLIFIVCLGVSEQLNAQCNDRPIINDFSPKTGFIGSTVTITGANFSATPGDNQVFFGATQATVVSSTFGTLEVRVPEGSTTSLISVKNQCNLTAYSKTHFNGIFCPTPLTSTSYQNVAQELGGIYGAYNMVSQDMDNDGKPEVVSAGLNRGVTIAKNNSSPGTISFSAYNFPTSTRTLAIADFDGDGKKDVVTNVSVLRNTSTGPGNFGLAYAVNSRGVSGYQIAAGDFNNDGKIDIIGENGNWIYVAFNTSTGPGNFNFTNRILVKYVGSRCTGIQAADIDGDGKTDFIASQGGANRAVSIRNTTADGSFTASFENPEYWGSGGSFPYRSQIADFDKDGRIDFTSCNYLGTTNTAIWRNTSTVGNISFAPTVNIPSPRNNYRIGVGDVDGDGYPDIVTKSLGVNVFSVYRNTTATTGSVSFAPRFDYTSSSRAEVSGIVIGDLDGDFVPDIATSGISSNTIRFHRNTGAQNDVTPPTVACRDITVALNPNGTVSITPEMIDNGSGDACGIESLTLSQTDFTCADIGENTVTLTATDGAGNTASCTATVNVQPAAIIVSGQTTVCQGETVTMNANDGDSYQWKVDGVDIPGATNQTYIATTSGSYTVEVTNAGGCSGESLPTPIVVNENPTVDVSPSGNAFLCPPNGEAVLTASQSSIYQWMLNGVDIPNATQQSYVATSAGDYSVRVIDLFGCSATSDVVSVSENPAEIDVLGDGNFGNVFPNQNVSQSFSISNTVAGSILDITNISIEGPDAAFFSLDTFGFGTSGTLGNTTIGVDVLFNAVDIRVYNAEFVVNSNDCDESEIRISLTAEITCLPASFLSVIADIDVGNDADACSAVVDYTPDFEGDPEASLTYSFSGATSGSGSGSGSGAAFNIGVTTVTLQVSNACGNDEQTFDIVVEDNTAPDVQVQDITVYLDGNGNASITAEQIDNGSSDNCAIETIELDNASFTCENLGDNTVSLYVTDTSGNISSASATVTVIDNIAPTVVTQDISVTLVDGVANITAASIDNGSYDNCDFSLIVSRDSFACSDIGDHTVTLTAVDSSGNTSSQTATVTVVGDIPTISIDDFTAVQTQDTNTIYLGFGPQSITLNTVVTGGTGFTYNWTSSSGEAVADVANPTISPEASTTYTVTVTNSNGCSATTDIYVCVIDVRAYNNAGNPNGKVIVCHHTNGKKGTKHVTISISPNAVMHHLTNHGVGTSHPDSLGECGATCIEGNIQALLKNNIKENHEENTFDAIVYPNPSNGEFEIKLVNAKEDVKIRLYDFFGKLIEEKSIKQSSKSQDVKIGRRKLSMGIYTLKIISREGTITKKVIIDRR
ncbi:FG-GAP-like repeat-containing protein [Pseudotenacibaculum haliotis]|uniref:FG-GAP-like repeat-containing protein n=1 Tax=Pseudotenacibaculum haliotis TaxID=1862138 RepID=A0ABW5LLX5_9FLAO